MAKQLTKRKSTVPTSSLQPKVQVSEDEADESDDPLSSSSNEISVSQEQEFKIGRHVKQVKKRKSEPAVRVTHDGPENEEDKRKRAKKGRKSELVLRKKPNDEYEEDIGRNESKEFLGLAESRLVDFEKQKKKRAAKENALYLESFKALLAKGEEQLNNQLKELSDVASKTDTRFLKAFKSIYSKVTPLQTRNTNGLTGFATMHTKSLELVAGANELVAIFEHVEKKIAEMDVVGMLDNEWAQEDHKIDALISEGRDIGVAKYRGILIAKGREVDEDQAGAQFYSQERVMEGATGAWGEVARKQEKAVRKLVKSVVVLA